MSEVTDLEARVAALEMLVAYLFASQHMQTADPNAALTRLKALVLDPDNPQALLQSSDADVAAAVERLVGQAAELQEVLPKRLVD